MVFFHIQNLFVQTMARIGHIQRSYIIGNRCSFWCKRRVSGIDQYGSYSEILWSKLNTKIKIEEKNSKSKTQQEKIDTHTHDVHLQF